MLQFASISFDASAEEIYPCLMRGATLVLRNDAMMSSSALFLQTCHDGSLTVLNLPTAYWHELTARLAADALSFPPSVRLVIIGGERALPELVATWQRRVPQPVRLVNTYGPTEATVVATWGDISPLPETGTALAEVAIGRAAPNVDAYVLDRQGHPVPIGIPGELYLGGVGLARGYRNRPALTAEQFVPDPFSAAPGARLYKTGDQVRYRADGTLAFLGRRDHQVKLRGFRIELGEIESVLGQHPTVRQVLVVDREAGPGDTRLVAYVVSEPGFEVSDLLSFLREKLPAYMIPLAFVRLQALTLTPSGKVDRRALPAPDRARPEPDASLVAPRTPLERCIAEIWQALLAVEQVSIYDNFFDLGGHSLLSMQFIARFGQQTGLQVYPKDLIFQTLGQLAAAGEAQLPHLQPSAPVTRTQRFWQRVKRTFSFASGGQP